MNCTIFWNFKTNPIIYRSQNWYKIIVPLCCATTVLCQFSYMPVDISAFKKIFFLFSIKTYVVGTQKNGLNDRFRTGLKSNWIYRAFLKSHWKLNMPWKVRENHANTLKVLEFFYFLEELALLIEIENRIKLLCLHLVQQMLHQIKAQQFYANFLILISPLSQASISEVEF